MTDGERHLGAGHPPPWPRGPAWGLPTRPISRPRRRSGSTSGRWPIRSGCAGAITRTPSRPGPAWPRPTAPPGRARTPSRSTSGCWPTGSGSQGADHPDTIAARANLAYAYRSAGRLRGGASRCTSDAGRPGAGPGRGPPGHADRALQPGRLLSAGPPADRRDPAVRAGAGRQRADARAGRHGDADHAMQPGHRVLHGGPPAPTSSRSCSAPWPTASVTWDPDHR